jgi:hypothetical protein
LDAPTIRRFLAVGETSQYTVMVKDSSGTVLDGRSIVWSTSDASILSVSQAGVVTAESPGSVTVSVASEGKSATADVVVSSSGYMRIAATAYSLPSGATAQLTALVMNGTAGATPVAVTWTTSDAAVAGVSNDGAVTAHSVGSAEITGKYLKAAGREFTATIRISVQAPVLGRIAFISARGPPVGTFMEPLGGIYFMNADGTNPQRVLENEVMRCSTDPFPADTCQQWWNKPSLSGDGLRFAATAPRMYEIELPRVSVLHLCSTANVYCVALGPFPQQMTVGRSPIPFVASDPAWSPDGTRLAYARDGIEYWRPADYRFVKVRANTTDLTFSQPAWSPDGTRLAVVGRTPEPSTTNTDIWIMNADGTNLVRLTSDPAADTSPVWSPDGGKIAFVSTRDADPEIYVMNADGTAPTNLTHSSGADDSPSWSPDGSKIAFQSDRDGNLEIYVMDADGQHAVNLTHDPAPDRSPVWGP